MPHLFAIALCILIVAGLAGLVRLEYKRAQKGPRMASTAFFRGVEEPNPGAAKPASRAIQHEIGY